MELKALLTVICEACAARGGIGGAELAHAAGLSMAEAAELIARLDAEGLAEVEEYGFSCSVEYSVSGLTPAGLEKLNE